MAKGQGPVELSDILEAQRWEDKPIGQEADPFHLAGGSDQDCHRG